MTHIFVINNNITQLLTLLVIREMKLSPDLVLLIYLRSSSPCLPSMSSYRSQSFPDANNFSSELLESVLHQLSSFHLYIPHNGNSSSIYRFLSNSVLCSGFSYLEEGTMSYSKFPFTFTYRTFLGIPLAMIPIVRLITKKQRFCLDSTFHCINQHCFPFVVDATKKIVHKNIPEILQEYLPQTTYNSLILSISPRDKYSTILNIAKSLMRNNQKVYVKFHPSLSSEKYHQKYSKLLKLVKNFSFTVLDSTTFLEFEMLANNSIILGSKSSLSIYSRFLGTTYIRIDKPGFFTHLRKYITQ